MNENDKESDGSVSDDRESDKEDAARERNSLGTQRQSIENYDGPVVDEEAHAPLSADEDNSRKPERVETPTLRERINGKIVSVWYLESMEEYERAYRLAEEKLKKEDDQGAITITSSSQQTVHEEELTMEKVKAENEVEVSIKLSADDPVYEDDDALTVDY